MGSTSLVQEIFYSNFQLYLKDTFPNFVEGKLFGSAAPETISERRRAIEVFLNFVLKSEVLCKARTFQTFLEVRIFNYLANKLLYF